MAGQARHLRDDIRRTFTAYALVPVFLIAAISVVMALMYWKTNVVERNETSRVLVGEALTAIIGGYMEKEAELAESCDLERLRGDVAARTELYRRLYAQVNITHDHADFYVVDERLELLLSSAARRPDFLNLPAGAAWGVVGAMRADPTRAALGFVGADGPHSRSLAVGQAIVREGRVKGYLVFVIPGAYLLRAISNPYVQFVIGDPYDYAPVATNDAFSDAAVNKLRPQLREASGYFSLDGQRYYMTKEAILGGALTVHAITPVGGMVDQYITAAAILLGVLCVMTIVIVIRVSRETMAKTRAIDQLVEAFAAVRQGDLDRRLDIRTNNEFQIIAEAYNMMLGSLKELMRSNDEKTRETVISEIKQLESQFNPHFLFNTLENIRFMIKLEPAAAGRMIVALSALLRYSIDNKIGEVAVGEDMEYARNYLDIQKMRFGERLTYEIRVEERVRACIVPKLIFQPIIENAIKYGAADGGAIHLETEVWQEGEMLEIVVYNSGAGMDAPQLAKVRAILAASANATQHTGLYNVHRRIQLIYGAAYGVEIMSEPDAGTTVRIVLPLRRR